MTKFCYLTDTLENSETMRFYIIRIANVILALTLLKIRHIHGDDTVSVGKLRNNADSAFSKGDLDTALNIWSQVRMYSHHLPRDVIAGRI